MNDTNDPDIHSASTRSAGISALRQIRRLVDAETTLDQLKARWARRISLLMLVFLGLLLTYFWLTRV